MENDNRVATPRTQKTFKQRLMSLAVKPTLRYIDRDPEKNVPKLLDWIIKLDKTGKYATTQSLAIKTALQNKTSNWNVLVKNLWNDVDRSIIKKVFENFVINSGIIGQTNQEKIREQYKCNVPWAILMDPTTACNLKCTGC